MDSMVRLNYFFLLVVLTVMLGSCSSQGEQQKATISVSILPQKYFTEQLVGNTYDINVLIPPGASPATYDPPPGKIQRLVNSKLYFKMGYLEFEKNYLDNIKETNKQLKIVNTAEGVNLIEGHHRHHVHDGDEVHDIHGAHGTHDTHDAHGAYDVNDADGEYDGHAQDGHDALDALERHAGQDKGRQHYDPHIWVSPKQVKLVIENMYGAINQLDTANRDFYGDRYKKFMNSIDSIDRVIRERFSDLNNRKFIIFHPALSYLARDYGLEQISIEVEGKKPTAATIKEVIDIAKERNIKTILIQQQFPMENARAIADEIGGAVVQVDPLAEDWLKNMDEMTLKLKQALETDIQ